MLTKKQLQLIEYNLCNLSTECHYFIDYLRDKNFKKDDDTVLSHLCRLCGDSLIVAKAVKEFMEKNNG